LSEQEEVARFGKLKKPKSLKPFDVITVYAEGAQTGWHSSPAPDALPPGHIPTLAPELSTCYRD
jgi:hypothetical protein